MAKMYGSYESLDGGSIVSGLSVLTGYPCDVIHFRGKEGNESNSTVLYNATCLLQKDMGIFLLLFVKVTSLFCCMI